MAPPGNFVLSAVWAFGPSDAWAVGGAPVTRAGEEPATDIVLHWDGVRWSQTAGVGLPIYLTAIWGRGPKDLWVGSQVGAVFHYDGAAWTALDSGTNQPMASIWGSDQELFVAGTSGGLLRRPLP